VGSGCASPAPPALARSPVPDQSCSIPLPRRKCEREAPQPRRACLSNRVSAVREGVPMFRKSLIGVAVGALLLAGCGRQAEETTATTPDANAYVPAPASDQPFEAAITAADFAELTRTLASDEFEGRGPGSVGEERTVEYIRAQMQRIGLQPGNGDSFFQEVPMVETTADPATRLSIKTGDEAMDLAFGPDMVVGTRTGEQQVSVRDSEMVFVGYGVDAPERDWNVYAGQDWSGKTVVMFVNDPGFHTNDGKLFDGRKMTYYGRWTYKFEEAA